MVNWPLSHFTISKVIVKLKMLKENQDNFKISAQILGKGIMITLMTVYFVLAKCPYMLLPKEKKKKKKKNYFKTKLLKK